MKTTRRFALIAALAVVAATVLAPAAHAGGVHGSGNTSQTTWGSGNSINNS